MIDEERAELAVEYLRETARKLGQLKGHLAYCDSNLRRVKSIHMIATEGPVGEREARAYASPAYKEAIEALQNATAEYETIRALREAAIFTIEVWRSQNSTRRQGHV